MKKLKLKMIKPGDLISYSNLKGGWCSDQSCTKWCVVRMCIDHGEPYSCVRCESF